MHTYIASLEKRQKKGYRYCTDPQKLDQESNEWRSVFFMTKHSFEFKKKIVLEYLNGKGGILYLSKKYGLSSKSQLHKWVKNYKAFGMMVYCAHERMKFILSK